MKAQVSENAQNRTVSEPVTVREAYEHGRLIGRYEREADERAGKRQYRRLTPLLAEILADRTEGLGSYWKAADSLGVSPGVAWTWKRKAEAGREPYRGMWVQVQAALVAHEKATALRMLAKLNLTPAEIEKYRHAFPFVEALANQAEGGTP